jgi:PPOX class probable F420-dependent enzyme
MNKTSNDFSGFQSQKYMNIETFRRSGDGVRTPVWFVESGGALFLLTRGDSGKVKRLRHNKAVQVAPCKMDGEVIGDWFAGEATFVESEEAVKSIKSLFDEKYGAISRLTNVFSRLQRKKRVFIKVVPGEQK